MRVLIIEDEARIAKRLERMASNYFEQNSTISICDSVQKGMAYIENNEIDLLLLDLNLNGENGFDLLESVVSKSFHTIIVSANTDKAIMAFEYGVLDFVPKPFDEIRLAQAFKRIKANVKPTDELLKFLAVKKAGDIKLIDIEDLLFIKGAGIYSELHLRNGKQELHDKSLETLEQLLPYSFERIHKSYLVSLELAEKILIQSGSKYSLLLKSGEQLPIGRSKYKDLKNKIV
ncbi:response regulator transcription factor [Pedobacter frigiditerrae]|uniref:Response regulator transcription factor n=1 Tax=Pedobacter frigiditerrae TaxID=2530452 RepID=A0A4R0N105_9SPHI|nr:LytTR family DNA-binding domain-containing protein [Pedobacter frigiditerrae]TCC93421.1 response regulator transcription factor [Pedobacter frigiditerrae]